MVDVELKTAIFLTASQRSGEAIVTNMGNAAKASIVAIPFTNLAPWKGNTNALSRTCALDRHFSVDRYIF